MNGPGKATSVVASLSAEFWRTLSHPLASDAVLLTISNYIAAAMGLLTVVAAVRVLGPSDYGISTMVVAYPTLILSFVSIKSESITTRYIAIFRTGGRQAELMSMCKFGYCLDLIFSTIAFVLVLATAGWISAFIHHLQEQSWLMITYAASFPFMSMAGTNWAILSSFNRFRWLACLQIFYRVISFVLVVGLLYADFGVSGMVLGMGMSHVVMALVMGAAACGVLYREGCGSWWHASLDSVASLKSEFRSLFGWNYVAVTISGLMEHLPLLLLGRLRGPEEAGFYRLAANMVTAVSYCETTLGRFSYPVLSARSSVMKWQSLKSSLRGWTLKAGIPLGTLVIFAVLVLPIVVPFAFGREYGAMVPAAQVMLAGCTFSAIFFWLNALYYSVGMVRSWTLGYSLYTSLAIGLGWLSIQHWGFCGLAWVVGLGKAVFTLSMVVLLMAPSEIRSERFSPREVKQFRA